jgi:Amt family ammonium transporter
MGNTSFFWKQVAAVVISSIWAFAFTYGMLWLINKITKVRVSEAHESTGLDASLHGEQAYL